jgi:ABC-type uncharacterized transport system involved in gliding motility auxiliary subunit
MGSKILSFMGWVGTALVGVAVAIRFLLPAREQYAFYLAWAGLICVLAYTLGQWREIAALFSRRQARYGTLAGVSVAVVLGILTAINYIGAQQHKRWDLTSNQVYSLSDQTRGVLSKLDAPMQILVFAREAEFPQYRDRLNEYEYASKRVSVQYIDPDKQPALARQNQVQQYGTIVIAYKGRTEHVASDTEQDITTGVLKVVTGQQKKVYFTQGHGERDTVSAEREGYNAIVAALGRENYLVDKIVLAQQGAVPDDAAVVVIAGPHIDFFPPEIDALKAYLGKSGKLLMELDPPDKPDSPPLTNLLGLAHDWGMDVGSDIVVDVSGMGRLLGTSEAVPVAANYPVHAITDHFNYLTAFPLARSVTPVSGGVNGHTAQTFIETSPRSWAETDVSAVLQSKPVEYDEGKDKKGPVSIACAVAAASAISPEKPEPAGAAKPETRVIVIGDSDFAANAGLGIQGNRDLFMNMLGWISQQENLISIRPREPDDRRLTLTATQQANLTWLALVVIPLVIFGAGIYTWTTRRR